MRRFRFEHIFSVAHLSLFLSLFDSLFRSAFIFLLSLVLVRVNQNESGVLSLPCHAIPCHSIIIILDGRKKNLVKQSVSRCEYTIHARITIVYSHMNIYIYSYCMYIYSQGNTQEIASKVRIRHFWRFNFAQFVHCGIQNSNSSDFGGYNYHVSHQHYVMWMSNMSRSSTLPSLPQTPQTLDSDAFNDQRTTFAWQCPKWMCCVMNGKPRGWFSHSFLKN